MSGEDCLTILRRCSAQPFDTPKRPQRLQVPLLVQALGEVTVIAMIWPGSQSYTGSPTIEIHTHGSLPILEAIVATLVHAGAKPAAPGEFTMRAFLAGRLDLTQAEAVLGVIDARSQTQLDAALEQLAGNLAAPLKQTRRELIDLLADIEAGLDFVDEDIQFISDHAIREQLHRAMEVIAEADKKLTVRRRSEACVSAVLRGEPNAGKSSLLNALCAEEAAIVSNVAGTTRDTIWRDIRCDDVWIRLMDTAGIETAQDDLQSAGQQMAEQMAEQADLVIHCSPAHRVAFYNSASYRSAKESSPRLASDDQTVPKGARHELFVATMCDQTTTSIAKDLSDAGWIITSSVTGEGIAELKSVIAGRATQLQLSDGACVPGTAARCADTVDRVIQSLQTALSMLEQHAGQEYVADQIRQALSALGEVTGEIYTDDILDRVFSRFCIGK